METTTAAPPPLPDSPTSPSTSVASSSTTSWPATEIGSSVKGDTSGTATPSEALDTAPPSPAHSLVESPPPSATAAPLAATSKDLPPLDTKLSQAPPSAEEAQGEVDDTPTLATPASATWSRSRLPVSDDTDEGLSPIGEVRVDGEQKAEVGDEPVVVRKEDVEEKKDEPEEHVVEQEEKEAEAKPIVHVLPPATDDVSTPAYESTPARPAFVLTRPTLSGENELVSITQPSTPSASVKDDDGEDAKEDNKDSPPTSAPEATPKKKDTQPITLDTSGAFLTETKVSGAFFASPVPVSAVSPRTNAFFGTDFQIHLPSPPSPPRPGGACITELPSDVESLAEKVSRTIVPSTTAKKDDRKPKEDEKLHFRSSVTTQPLRSPRGHEDEREHDRHHSKSRNLKSPRPSRSRSRSPAHGRNERRHRLSNTRGHHGDRYGVQSSDSSSSSDSEEDDYRPRLPFVHSRTIVSARIPKLPSGRDSLPPPRHDPQQQQRDSRLYFEVSHQTRGPPSPPPQPAMQRPYTRPTEEHKPLEVLLREVKLSLEKEPAAFYAVKGVLAEFEEEQRERRREAERRAPQPQPVEQRRPAPSQQQHRHQQHRFRDEQPPVYRNPKRPSYPPPAPRALRAQPRKHQKEQARRPETAIRVAPPVARPVHRYSLTQTSDEESETETEKVVQKSAARPSYQYKPPQLPRLEDDHAVRLAHRLVLPPAPAPPPPAAVSQAPLRRHAHSPSPPEYPPHLSPRKGHGKAKELPRMAKEYPIVRKTSGGPPPPPPMVVKPVPVRVGEQHVRLYEPERPLHRHAVPPSASAPRHNERTNERDDRDRDGKRFPSPARGETLTVAQAARLAEGLGRDDEAERLRTSGLRGKDKVSKIEGKAKGAKKEEKKPLRRRHSFDSVVDFHPKKKHHDHDRYHDRDDEAHKKLRYGDLKKPGATAGERDLPFRLKSFHLPSLSASLDETDVLRAIRAAGVDLGLGRERGPPAPSAAALPTLKPGGEVKRGSKDGGGGVYPSPTVENGKVPHFYFGPPGSKAQAKAAGAKSGGKEKGKGKEADEAGRNKRTREQSVPQVNPPTKRVEKVVKRAYGGGDKARLSLDEVGAARFDFDDFM
ncbi:hypothetical protein JCM6882_002010 [Rhodosporidiobolus microsporus]